MNIVLASDKNYLPHLETLVISICENNIQVGSFVFYIFANGFTDDDKRNLSELIRKYDNVILRFIDMDDQIILNKFGVQGIGHDRSLSTYARIFIPEYVDGDRALYLDVDAVIRGDIAELYDMDMEDYAIAGVKDVISKSEKMKIGLDPTGIYICAGMILWNLKVCREIDFIGKCKCFLKERNFDVEGMDQSVINGVLSPLNKIKAIHPKYNVTTIMFRFSWKDIQKSTAPDGFYSQEDFDEALKKPIFLHFTPGNTTRPWVEKCKHPLKDEYWKYRKLTNYHDIKLLKDTRSAKMKVISWIYFHFPVTFYLALLKIYRIMKR